MVRRHFRSALALGALALAATGCSENPSSPSSVEQAPTFVRWAAPAQTRFVTEGVGSAGFAVESQVLPTPPVVLASSNASGSTRSLSWAHNGGSGSNRLVLVTVSLLNASRPVTGVTYQGSPLSFLGARNDSDDAARVELWYLRAPPVGTGTVVVTTTGSDRLIAGALTLSGVDPTSPLGRFMSAGSTTTSSNPSLSLVSAPGELVVDVVVAKAEEVSVTAGGGQTQQYRRSSGEAGVGAVSTRPGGAAVTMAWTKNRSARWAMAAVAIKPVPLLPLSQYHAQMWLVRGQSRTLQIDYAGSGASSPFMRLTASDPTWVPGTGALAVGDSVLVTATVDPNSIAVTLQPHGIQFGSPSELKIWYGGSGGDLNGDGVVDATDANIEAKLLGMWYQATPGAPWSPISAVQSLSEKSFTTPLQHFSQYAVAW